MAEEIEEFIAELQRQEVAARTVRNYASDLFCFARAPKSLDKREVDRLIRMAEREGNKRNLAILQTLRQTGIRVGGALRFKAERRRHF